MDNGAATYLYPIDVPPLTLPPSQMQFPTLQPAGTFLQQMHSPFADAPLQHEQHLQHQRQQESKTLGAFSGHAAASPTSPSSVSAAASSLFLASIRRGLDDLVHQYDDDSDDDDSDDDDDDSPRYYSASSAHTYYSPPSSLSAPYDCRSAPSALLQPSALFTAHAPTPFQCDWDIGIGGSIWTSGQILAEHLQLQQQRYRPLFDGKCVVELGSGTGIVGLATAAVFAPARVYLTDLASHTACLARNVALNAGAVRPGVDVRVAELAWGSDDHERALLASLDANTHVDVILGTDVAYLRELYEPLLHTLRAIANDSTLVLLGLNRADTGMTFFERLEQNGFEYYKIADEQLPRDYHGKDFGLFEIRRCGGGQRAQRFGGRS